MVSILLRRAGLTCVCAACAAACILQARAGYGQLRALAATAEALAAATRIDQADAALWRRLGIALLPRDQTRAEAAFTRAAALNPYDTDSLLALGLLSESRRQFPIAEHYLVRATRVSRRIKPRTELAAFYLRRQDEGKFWDVAREAVAIEAADAGKVFEMAHQAEPDAAIVPRLLRPPTDGTRAAYLAFTLDRNYAEAAAKVAPAIAPTPRTRDVLLLTCERLIDASLAREAVEIWNRLAAANLVAAGTLRPESGASLTNGEFKPSEFRGFNWRPGSPDGVEAAFDSDGLRIELSDRGPEQATLVQQFLPVIPARKYRLTCRYGTSELRAPTGLRWRVLAAGSEGAVASRGGGLDALPAADVALEFETPPGAQIVLLLLTYERPVGSVRQAGSLTLRRAELRPAE